MKTAWRWNGLLLVVVGLFFWKILFTQDFSVFVNHDNSSQMFSWNHFAANEIRRGRLPLWDPYVQAGHSFIGEMQTALFYPPKLLIYYWPFGHELRLQHVTYVVAHVLGACFMFLLCRELALSGFRSEERRVGKECRSRWSPY